MWEVWGEFRSAFNQKRTWQRAGELLIGVILNMGRHTITGAITTIGQSQHDWSAYYRLFERNLFNLDTSNAILQTLVTKFYQKDEPIIALIDDTQIKKRGMQVHGAKYLLDKLGPKFHNNFIWACRFTQISIALREGEGRCRSIPVSFEHTPTAKKPKKNASPEELDDYKLALKEKSLATQAAQMMKQMQKNIKRKIIWVGDGGYTTKKIIREISDDNVYIGRMRKDAKLFRKPDETKQNIKRKRIYGEAFQTPQEALKDDEDFKKITVETGGGKITFEVKSYTGLRSKMSSDKNLKLLIVKPLRNIEYEMKRKAPRLPYRNPAYIICSDDELCDEKILQYYLWRWEIELNFKDQKSLMGIDESHVRTKNSMRNFPAFVSLAYSLLLLARKRSLGEANVALYPKWRNLKKVYRDSTGSILAALRFSVINLPSSQKNGFVTLNKYDTKSLLSKDLNERMVSSVSY